MLTGRFFVGKASIQLVLLFQALNLAGAPIHGCAGFQYIHAQEAQLLAVIQVLLAREIVAEIEIGLHVVI